MSEPTNNNYKTTFILDLRNSEDDSQKVLADITEILGSLGGQATGSEDHGMKEFARAADQRFTQGHYLEVRFSGPGSVPGALKEKLRLDKRVNRTFIETV